MTKIQITYIKHVLIILLILLAGFGFQLSAQLPFIPYDSLFVTKNNDTLKNAWAGGLNAPQFSNIDLNHDGLKDLVIFERNFYGSIKTFLNTGSPGISDYTYAPLFEPYFPAMHNWMLLRDFNCDGREDIFTSVPAGVAVYRNDTPNFGPPVFTPVTFLLPTIGLDGQVPLYVSTPDIPAITDVDGDGDLDILTFNTLGSTLEYHKNMSLENYGTCEKLEFELKNACWGYFSEDGNNNSVILFDTCDVNVIDPEKTSKHAGSTILAIDLDGNNSKDLILGDITYPNLIMLTNGGNQQSAGMIFTDTAYPSNNLPVNMTIFPATYSIDTDNDGLEDLLVAPNNPNTSENFNNVWYYHNEGTASIPEFVFKQNNFLQDEIIDVGERSFPIFFDENGDGLEDILIGNFGYFIASGNYESRLMLLRNSGSESEPAFVVQNENYAGLAIFQFNGIYPAVGDMDNDGDKDMLTGDEDGLLHYFRNDGSVGGAANFVLSQPNFMGIDVGQSAKPQIIDVNRDGLPDLLVGARDGTINYFENSGTPENAIFSSDPTIAEFGQVDVMPECCTGYSAPFMTEDSTGNYQLFVGSEQGYLYLFNNIENNLNGIFHLQDSLNLQGVNVNVNGFDMNQDGKIELVFGAYTGGVGLLKNGLPPALRINDIDLELPKIKLYPNPAGETLNIEFQAKVSGSLRILNAFGKDIMNLDDFSEKQLLSLNTSILRPGFYIVEIYLNGKTISAKFIKQ